mmetsp:Transcript_29014/g.67999  ORF Transcript_29014/g.67999 Transcript_29014/m.67999 type:complete len:565 (-) Transcript_29014:51-1745(-)
MALQILLAHPDATDPYRTSARVLVCAPSNGAADVILERLAKYGRLASFREQMGWAGDGSLDESGNDDGEGPGVSRSWLHRFNSTRRTLASFGAHLHRHACIFDGSFAFHLPGYYRSVPVLISTCVTALDLVACGGLPLDGGVPRGYFTHILIDEASQGLEPELLIPLTLGRKPSEGGSVVVLVGDHRQLGPTVRAPALRRPLNSLGLDQSLLERLMSAFEGDGNFGFEPSSLGKERSLAAFDSVSLGSGVSMGGDGTFGCEPSTNLEWPFEEMVCAVDAQCTMLRRNYRSHPALLELPSKLFYENSLIFSANETESRSLEKWSELGAPGTPLLFYGLVGQQLNEVDSPSFFNPTEAAMVVNLINKMLGDKSLDLSTNDFGVITIYRKQVLKLRRLLRDNGLGAVRVGSVDDYQGQEEKVVIISTVLSHREAAERVSSGGLVDSLVASPQRFNVAITRAKSLLVIVGNPHALAVDPSWRSLLAHALERGCYRGVPFSLTEGRGGRGERGARAENDEGGDDEGEEEDAEAMLSRLAESALGGAYGARGGELDHLDLSFDLEWRLMI